MAPRVILVDGQALLYRAYYAIPASFSTAAGLPTNAVYGFATMFRKMLAGRRPEYGAVVFDPPGPTFRDALYPAYKAQRPSMPEDLRPQLEWVDRLVEAHSFPYLRVPGYEADDVIGTLTRLAVEAGMEVFIVSGDKDFAQLIDENVRMVDTLRDITYDPELVRKKWGVPPALFVDLLALMGDKVDNIPGVPGIGAKGAATLLEKYGSLDAVLRSTAELKGRQKKTLEENSELAELSRTLATIDRHVPLEEGHLEKGLDDLHLELPEPSSLNGLYRELEFYSLLTEDAAASEETDADTDYAAVRSLDELAALLDELDSELDSDEIDLDAPFVFAPTAVVPIFDGHSPVYGRLAGLAFCTGPGRARFVPIFGQDGLGEAAVAQLRSYFADPDQLLITYNAKFLFIALRRLDVDLQGVVGDVLLESFLVDPTKIIPHGLGQIVKEYLRRTVPPSKTIRGSGKKERLFSQLALDEIFSWACRQADVVAEVWQVVRERLGDDQLQVLEGLDLRLAPVLGAMEIEGIGVDGDDLQQLGEDFSARLAEVETEIFRLAGREFNVGSPKQLSAVLFDELKLPVVKRTKTGYSTNAEVLERLAPKHEIARHLLEHRKLAKLINTYTDVLQRAVHPLTGRIHTTFQQTVGATGRLITTDPDLQRTPVKTPEGRRIRRSFVPRDGMLLLSADWSQIELRLLAHFTQRQRFSFEAFAAGLGRPQPDRGAALRRGGRRKFKPRDARGRQAGQFLDDLRPGSDGPGTDPGRAAQEGPGLHRRLLRGLQRGASDVARPDDRRRRTSDGYVETILGRRRVIPELKSNSFMDRQTGERMAANTPIQGSAADLCKLAMVGVARGIEDQGLSTRMLLQIHDELVFDVPEDEVDTMRDLVRREMEGCHPLNVPLKVDMGFGKSWAEAH